MRAASERGDMHLRGQKSEGENANVTVDPLAKVFAALDVDIDVDIVALLLEPATPTR